MVDVFISYSRAEIDRVRPLNAALRGLGLETFFDVEGLDGSDEFPEKIGFALSNARCVVGVWSPAALTRPWVKREARVAAHRKVLITARIAPLVLEDCADAVDFVGRHLTDLETFTGEVSHSGFLELVRAIAEKLGRPSLVEITRIAGGSAIPDLRGGGGGTTPAAQSWARISGSVDPKDYDDFSKVFRQAPESFEARVRKRRLEEWNGMSKTDVEEIDAFQKKDGVFPLLFQMCIDAKDAAVEDARKTFVDELAAWVERELDRHFGLEIDEPSDVHHAPDEDDEEGKFEDFVENVEDFVDCCRDKLRELYIFDVDLSAVDEDLRRGVCVDDTVALLEAIVLVAPDHEFER